ncbi:MAG TPA: PspC domain-containing protein, partial [Acidimicrobiales bacterium]|nr:PspC domain-containing protein [Acidimicrobiales bacterium]
MAAGVAGGLSARFGVDANVIRVLFVLLIVGGGTGFTLYVLAWLFIPREGDSTSIARRALGDRRAVTLALGLGTLFAVALVVVTALGFQWVGGLIWPLSLGTAGLVFVWHGAEDDEKAFLQELLGQTASVGTGGAGSRWGLAGRVVLGVAMVGIGLGLLVAQGHLAVGTTKAVVAALVVLAGFLVAFGPWWLRLARDVMDERRERVRAEERADMAAHIHDSVLQTLALIQRSSDDPREVRRLARVQERELRAWLFEDRVPGTIDGPEVATLAAGVRAMAQAVEESHRIAVEVVVVGDCELDETLLALLAAGREAVVNAAKWSEAAVVSVFAEVEEDRVTLFVRDRGVGFDPADVADDRRGIAESIRAR